MPAQLAARLALQIPQPHRTVVRPRNRPPAIRRYRQRTKASSRDLKDSHEWAVGGRQARLKRPEPGPLVCHDPDLLEKLLEDGRADSHQVPIELSAQRRRVLRQDVRRLFQGAGQKAEVPVVRKPRGVVAEGDRVAAVQLGPQPGVIEQERFQLLEPAGPGEMVGVMSPGVGVGKLLRVAPGVDQPRVPMSDLIAKLV